MTDAVRDAYDARAEEYAGFAMDDLDRVPLDREWLRAFASLVSPGDGVVGDLGCGPGHVVHHLSGSGLQAVGTDVSPAMIDAARRAFPGQAFRVGDLTSLDMADASLAGIVSRYSLIHLPPARLPAVFAEWSRVLRPQAPVLLWFFAASSAAEHGAPFDHAVVLAHALFPATLVADLAGAGFEGFEVALREPLVGERALDHATVLARRGSG